MSTLTEKDRSYYAKKIVALRKCLQALEEELEYEAPVLPKRKRNNFREHLENTVAVGLWRKPEHLKMKNRINKKAAAQTTAKN